VTERLNKVLARAGVASRRGSDELIAQGRVTVNGETVRELGTRVDPRVDVVRVDGRRVGAPPARHSYYMLNKPRGYVTTLSDPEGRPTVRDLLTGVRPRVFPVGRLDFHSEGLLLLTDDGDLAHGLTHPGRGVPKTYAVKVRGTPDGRALARLRRGIRLDGRPTLPARVRLTKRADNSWLELIVVEGRQHLVRRMLAAVGHPVLKLKRTALDGLKLGRLPSGRLRPLTPDELARLRRATASREGRGRSVRTGSVRRN
jgi:pseudouridine synthase